MRELLERDKTDLILLHRIINGGNWAIREILYPGWYKAKNEDDVVFCFVQKIKGSFGRFMWPIILQKMMSITATMKMNKDAMVTMLIKCLVKPLGYSNWVSSDV